jgi:TolB-like protein/DNA-binding winged helix-turn-helix (wHTH) protein
MPNAVSLRRAGGTIRPDGLGLFGQLLNSYEGFWNGSMHRPAAHLVYDFGDFRVDSMQRLLLLRATGRPLPLSSRAFDTLLFFLENRGKLLDKSTLMAAVWPNVIVEENNLNQNISALRRVFGETRDDHRFIVTEPGRGYRFVAEVTTRSGSEDPPPPLPTPPAVLPPLPEVVATPDPGQGPPVRSHSRRHAPFWTAATIAVAAIVGVAVWWFSGHTGETSAPREAIVAPIVSGAASASARGPARLRLAILPFQNLSPDPNNAFFADGLHEEILSTIGQRLRGVQVISRTTMMSDRLKAQSIATVASELGATHVIEGSVRREGKTVRLTLQLIDAGTDQQIWTKSYDRTLSSALTLESEVAQEVASLLSVQLASATQGPGPPTADAEAYDLYLKAVLALRDIIGNSSPAEFKRVDDLLTNAIARDPQFSLAYTQRARASTLLYIGGQDTSARLLQRIRDDLAAARALAPQEPMALAAEGYFLYAMGENERALASMNAAEAAGLTDPVFLLPKTRLLLKLSRVEEAVRLDEHLLEIDPANPLLIEFVVDDSWVARRPAEALRVADLAAGQYADLRTILRFTTLLSFTGATAEMHAALAAWNGNKPISYIATVPPAVNFHYQLMRYEHRYADLRRLLQLVPPTQVPYGSLSDNFEMYDVGEIGNVPGGVQFRGWTALLMGDRAAAAREGQALLQFLRTKTVTPRNEFFIRRLEAEGQLFSGRPSQAIRSASASLALMPRSREAINWIGVAMITARIYAWAGAAAQADDLLKQLAVMSPGLPPASITRDPLFAVPLAHDPEYQSLSRSLEAQMTALNLH